MRPPLARLNQVSTWEQPAFNLECLLCAISGRGHCPAHESRSGQNTARSAVFIEPGLRMSFGAIDFLKPRFSAQD